MKERNPLDKLTRILKVRTNFLHLRFELFDIKNLIVSKPLPQVLIICLVKGQVVIALWKRA